MAKDRERYHHGDLRAALINAAELELEAKGMEGFSLRSVAKRAGVSHAAPAHHFGDMQGLLTALAARGFAMFLEAQTIRQEAAEAEPVAQLVASGMGYIDFALAHPALFQLMFGSSWPEGTDPEFQRTSEAAYGRLMDNVRAVTGADPEEDDPSARRAVSVWALVHGLGHLMIGGGPRYLIGQPPETRERLLSEIIEAMVRAPI